LSTCATTRERWERQVGADSVKALEETLGRLLADNTVRLDTPGRLMRDVSGES
jgi:hypothetical protein